MFETIEKIRPYFMSVREVNELVCLDIKIPITWNLENNFNETNMTIQDKDTKFYLLTIFSNITKEGYEEIFNLANNLIQFNINEETKKSLLQEKIKQLEELFKTESLDKLSNINFT